MTKWALLLFALVLATPVAAQQPRPLQAADGADWTHAGSGLKLPATIDGSRRVSIGDSGTKELDVVAQYEGAGGLVTTVYLFRPQLPNVPLWFDRGRTVLEQLRLSSGADNAPGTSASFALANGRPASAMRVTYPFSANGFASTGLAVAPAGGWLAKVRMSSKTLSPLQLDAKLAAFVGGIGWPAVASAAPAAEAVQPCPDKLAFRNSRMVKPDMAQGLLGSLMAMAGSAKQPDLSVRYCREQSEGVLYGVYRPVATKGTYLMAIADSGRVLSIGTAISLDPKAKPSYAVTLLDLDRTATYPSFDRLPQPDQVLNLIRSTQPLSSTEVGSRTINIDADPGRR